MRPRSQGKAVIYGVTGTQIGGTRPQLRVLEQQISFLPEGSVLHHGDCVGVDERAHWYARAHGHRIVIHPSTIPGKRAWCRGDEERDPLPPLERNDVICRSVERLFALPREDCEILRSGTWSTVRRGRRRGITVILILPDGRLVNDSLT